jgi:hypothetical protein
LIFQNFKANGLSTLGQKGSIYKRKGKKIVSYYVVDQLPLEIEFSIKASSILDMNLMESSFDLMNNPLFSMAKRANWMMPTPFVMNDAVVITQKIKPTPVAVISVEDLKTRKQYMPKHMANDSISKPKTTN